MEKQKTPAFMGFTRAFLSEIVGGCSKAALKQKKPAYLGLAAIAAYFWLIPVMMVDVLFTPILLFAWLRGDEDMTF